MTEKTIFEEIGGFDAIIAAVDIFYAKVMQDELLARFFEHLDMDSQGNKMVSFMAWAFGGPDEFKGRDLRVAHQGLVKNMGLNDQHFNAVATHLSSTLTELDVDNALIQRVLDLVGSTRNEVLDK